MGQGKLRKEDIIISKKIKIFLTILNEIETKGKVIDVTQRLNIKKTYLQAYLNYLRKLNIIKKLNYAKWIINDINEWREDNNNAELFFVKKSYQLRKNKDLKCVICNSNQVKDIHHILPQSQGGLDNNSNLMPLCKKCHKEVHDNTKKDVHSSSFSQYRNIKLTKIQEEILYLITKEYLTPKKIAYRQKRSLRAVYKIIEKLKQKGAISGSSLKGFKKTTPLPIIEPPKTLKYFKKYIRLHAQEFNIELITQSEHYHKLRNKGNIVDIDGNTIRLYKNSIEVYSNKDFKAEDEQRATALSFQYWNRFFIRLENYFKIIILKERRNNIKLVNSHYAEVDNELAEEYNEKKVKLHIYTTDDARLWFTIDHSFNMNEAETLHSKTAKQDMGKIKPYFNDIRDKNVYLPSEIKGVVDSIANNLAVLTKENLSFMYNFESYNKNIQLHLNVLKSMDLTLKAIRRELGYRIKPVNEHQLKLKHFGGVGNG